MNTKDQAPGQVRLRGKIWTICNVSWCAAEPDVGIMSDYVDEFDLSDEDGNQWDWDTDQLTKEEDGIVNDSLSQLIHEINVPGVFDYE